MDHIHCIDKGLSDSVSHAEIVRKVYLTFPTKIFLEEPDRQYEILNEISTFFSIPITSVQVTGSAKTGRSFHKKRAFESGISDLDIAIVDPELYRKYIEMVFRKSKGYKNKTIFPIRQGRSTFREYQDYVLKGIFRADLMPTCRERGEWDAFFGKISRRHGDLFKRVSASIYFSEIFFEYKQCSSIKCHIENRGI